MIGLKKPLLIGAVAAFLLLGLIAYFVSAMEDRLRQHAVEARPENLGSLRKIAKLELELYDLKGASANYLLTGDERWKNTIREHGREVAPAIERVRASVETPAEQAILDRIVGICAEARRVSELALSAHDAGRHEEARRLVTQDLWDLTRQLRTAFEKSIEFNAKHLGEAAAADLAAATSFRWATWGAVAGIGIGAALVGWLLCRVMAKRACESELNEIERLMSSFLAHEVRNPLAVLNMRVHSLHSEVRTDSAREDIVVMQEVITRLDRTIASFLEFARTEKPNAGEAEVRAIIDQAVDGVKPFLSSAGVRVEVLGERDAKAQADGRQLRVVLENLIVNGAQAMPRGGLVRLLVRRLSANRKAGRLVEIIVSDMGPGLPEHVRKNLFKPFVSGRSGGIGLGLTLSCKLARLNGGALELERSGDDGTSFRLTVPAASASPRSP
jgi:signal transduction histidine kinase